MDTSHSSEFGRTTGRGHDIRRRASISLGFLLLAVAGRAQGPAAAGPAITIDAAADHHAISPDIYGMNDNPWDPGLGREIRVPVSRWGGDATTRYNWEIDSTNAGADWYFTAGGKPNSTPSAGADKFVQKVKDAGGKALLTIPVIDYINKAKDWDCSFPVSIYGPQQKVNPYIHPIVNGKKTDAGNGLTADGKPIILDQAGILRVNITNTTAFQQAWIRHLMERFGTAAKGGVAIYEMDNEPGGWANTHRDVHPIPPLYPEIVDKTIPYARAVKETDPTALVDGPGDFGWDAYRGQPEKRGGLWNAEYYLQRMHDEEKKGGVRLLDYFDEHYYPTRQDGQTDETVLESTRSLWDRTYVEKDWIGKWFGAIYLIPRMREWVAKYYPGTRTAITEYNFGRLNTLLGGLTEADALGIFGREGLDLATIWGPPKPTEPGTYAFRLYRNYDGKGGSYGDMWVHSASADQAQLAVYGALRTKDGALTLVMINKTTGDLTEPVQLAHFAPAGPAQVWRYSAANLHAIEPQTDQPVSAAGFTALIPARSMTLFVIPGRQQ